MTDLQDALDQIKARHQEVGRADSAEGTFALEQSQADVPRLVEAIEAVMQECYRVLPNDPQGDAILNGIELSVSDKLAGEDDEQ